MAETTQRGRKKTSNSVNGGAAAKSSPSRATAVALPLDTLVRCTSAVPVGNLIYVSKQMQGMQIEWAEFGDDQYIELKELQSMRNSNPAFFENNWILIDDDEVLRFLRADKYYSTVKSMDDFDKIINMLPNRIAKSVENLSDNLKNGLAIVAYKKYKSGELDSLTVVRAIERATGISVLDD